MIDLKYHIASIVAVFLALGLGVIIGSTIVGDDLLVDQQQKLIERLEEQFYTLKDRKMNCWKITIIKSNCYTIMKTIARHCCRQW